MQFFYKKPPFLRLHSTDTFSVRTNSKMDAFQPRFLKKIKYFLVRLPLKFI